MRQRITISYATLSLDEKLLLLIKRKACTPFTISAIFHFSAPYTNRVIRKLVLFRIFRWKMTGTVFLRLLKKTSTHFFYKERVIVLVHNELFSYTGLKLNIAHNITHQFSSGVGCRTLCIAAVMDHFRNTTFVTFPLSTTYAVIYQHKLAV